MDDGKTVFLKIHDMKAVDNMKVNFRIKSSAGKDINSFIYNSVYNLSPDQSQVTDQIAVSELKLRNAIQNYPSGARLELKGKDHWQHDVA